MTTIKIKPENMHLVHALVELNERSRAERECAALGEQTKARMNELFQALGTSEGIVHMDVPDYCLETKYLEEHGLVFLSDGQRQLRYGGLAEIPVDELDGTTHTVHSRLKH